MDKSKGADARILEKRSKHAEYMRQRRAKRSEEDHQKELEKLRLRRAQMSEEKRKEICGKRRLQRNRQRTPDERQKEYERRLRNSGLSAEEYRLKENERKRLSAERRKKKPVSEEEKEKQFLKRQARRERKKKEMEDCKLNDPFKYREYLDKFRFWNVIRKASMTEEEKEEQRRKTYLYKQARKAAFTPEEIEEKRRKAIASSIRSQKKRWEEATEVEKEQRKVYCRIKCQKMKLRKNLFNEGLSSEEVKRIADEQEAIWWKEVYPDGKPPMAKRGIQSKQIWTPDLVISGNVTGEVEVFKYICVKCHPRWKAGLRKWEAVGFNLKCDLLQHVMEKHPSSYFPCSNCNLLKYSKKALDTHLTYCLNKGTSFS